jgi:Protein of unknown function (DUF4242)
MSPCSMANMEAAAGWTPRSSRTRGKKVFCLVEAPDAATAITVHREAHGLVVDRIFQVEEGS